MNATRWWLFTRLSALAWWICPEPHKTRLQAVMPQWADVAPALARQQPSEEQE